MRMDVKAHLQQAACPIEGLLCLQVTGGRSHWGLCFGVA